MKKIHPKRIAAGCGALALIGIVLYYYFGFNGNPFAPSLYQPKIEAYIEKNYPNGSYQVSYDFYEFNSDSYYYTITDPNSEDGSFQAYYDHGEIYDTYADVVNLNHTLDRLANGFAQAVNPFITPYLNQNVTPAKTKNDLYKETGWGSVSTGDKSTLYIDMAFDVKNMPVTTRISLHLNSDEQESFRRTQQIATILKENGYRIDLYFFNCNKIDGNHSEFRYAVYKAIPTETLLAAQSLEELKPYREK